MEKSIKRLCVMVNMIMLVLLKLFVHWCFWHIEVLLFFCHREKKKKCYNGRKCFLSCYIIIILCEYKKQYYVCKYNYLSKHGVHLFAFLKDKTVIYKNSCKCYAISRHHHRWSSYPLCAFWGRQWFSFNFKCVR